MAYSSTAVSSVHQGIAQAIPHEMTTPEWAQTIRFVDRGARKGKWSNDTNPALTEPMAVADDPLVREIIILKPVQWGGSEIGNNIIGKRIDQAPTEIIWCAEVEDKATAWTQESFDAMVRVTPELQKLISKLPEENNQTYKRFPGGGLYIVWATSPNQLSSRPAQIIVFDEKAAYKPTKEGDPVSILKERQTTYEGEELTIIISTPRRCNCTMEGETCGDVTHDYERGDQREYYVPCPHCEEFQTLKWGGKDVAYGLKWDPDFPEAPYYICEHCQSMIEEFDRDDMLLKGRWVASKEFNGIASFKINQLYSPFVSWAKIVAKFYEAQGNATKYEAFTNLILAEAWKPTQKIEYEDLAWNLEQYPASVPNGVLVLTAAVDVQKDRIECEVVGWGKDNECWAIAYKVFYGSPGIEVSNVEEVIDDAARDEEVEPLASVWDELAAFLMGSFTCENGRVLKVAAACIDSGFLTRIVYKFCRKYQSIRHGAKRWWPIKGMSDPFKPLVSKPTPQGRPAVNLFPIGTNAAKDEVFAALKVVKAGPGYCHFPDVQPYNEEAHMKMYASETMVTHTRGGRTYRVYEKVGPSVRNEALDLRVYNVAARTILNPNYDLIARRRLEHGEVADRPESDDPPETPPQVPAPKKNVVPFRGGSLTKNNPFSGYKP